MNNMKKRNSKKRTRSRMTVQAFCNCYQPNDCVSYCNYDATALVNTIGGAYEIANFNAIFGL